MVSSKYVEDQLKKIGFVRGWNRPEADELANILLPDEEIFECVNGWYEGGYSLLCATNIRVLLIDKKPFKFLTVEDLRFDTINQIDYSHRMMNASICITAGLKSLIFKSYNQPRLRKLISHVQHRMAEIKKIEQAHKSQDQNSFQDMDQQLKAYLLSQYEQHQSIRLQHEANLPPNMLDTSEVQEAEVVPTAAPTVSPRIDNATLATGASSDELYDDGVKEIFGKYQSAARTDPVKTAVSLDNTDPLQAGLIDTSRGVDVNPLRVAYSKLPMILRKRQATSTQ